jgi:hypothetical protein
LHGLREEPAVLGFADRRYGGAEELDIEFVQDARLVEFDGEVEGSLAAQGGKQGTRGGGSRRSSRP